VTTTAVRRLPGRFDKSDAATALTVTPTSPPAALAPGAAAVRTAAATRTCLSAVTSSSSAHVLNQPNRQQLQSPIDPCVAVIHQVKSQ
jgi:hypothetical protein